MSDDFKARLEDLYSKFESAQGNREAAIDLVVLHVYELNDLANGLVSGRTDRKDPMVSKRLEELGKVLGLLLENRLVGEDKLVLGTFVRMKIALAQKICELLQSGHRNV